ncbi:TraK family protein [Methylobacter sp. BBA5.1]|uniref:TraK family protein n=1 Tax=Methylobacter sp. BBA5.1 TaxID=1495064 RepID=UPI00056D6235|nr:TraK family protein [Methylobacter sp. BBA5.1]
MAKSYTEELADWVKKREDSRPRQDKNMVAFLAVRNDVKAAVEAGYAFKTIWEHMHETGKIPYRYETFLKHVRRYITHAPANQAKQTALPAPSQEDDTKTDPKADAMRTKASPEPKKNRVRAMTGFTFNPTPNKEDLF